jgi:hypothetical protein
VNMYVRMYEFRMCGELGKLKGRPARELQFKQLTDPGKKGVRRPTANSVVGGPLLQLVRRVLKVGMWNSSLDLTLETPILGRGL